MARTSTKDTCACDAEDQRQQILLTRAGDRDHYQRSRSMPTTKTKISALANTNRATIPASCQLTEHPTANSVGVGGIGYTSNPSQSSKPISRDDGDISFEPIRALSIVATKTNQNTQQRVGQHILARTTSHFKTTLHKTTEPPPEQPIRKFRTSNHVTTEPSSDKTHQNVQIALVNTFPREPPDTSGPFST